MIIVIYLLFLMEAVVLSYFMSILVNIGGACLPNYRVMCYDKPNVLVGLPARRLYVIVRLMYPLGCVTGHR